MRDLPLIIDIETAPVKERVADYLEPWPEFNAASVKLGNIKDEAKRVAKIADAEKAHQQAGEDYVEKAIEKAALHPETARIVAIGIIQPNQEMEVLTAAKPEQEAGIISDLFQKVNLLLSDPRFAGHSILYWAGTGKRTGFDHKMIAQRAWITKAKLPDVFARPSGLNNAFKNLTEDWLCGEFQGFCSLNKAAKMLGLFNRFSDCFDKDDMECTGDKWAEFFLSGDKDKQAQAIEYLENDLLLTWHIAYSMNLLS